jgi:opacity protein-like surface antigen
VPQYGTGLSFDYSRELSPLSQLGVGIGYALIEDTASSDQTQTASLTAVYSRDLTEDWALDLGYTYRQREEDNDGMARSNSVFLGLRRAWELRP